MVRCKPVLLMINASQSQDICPLLIRFKHLSLFLLSREMFKKNCKSIEKFPCYEDEWCKVSFADYAVTYADQPPNIWFVIFR